MAEALKVSRDSVPGAVVNDAPSSDEDGDPIEEGPHLKSRKAYKAVKSATLPFPIIIEPQVAAGGRLQ